MEIQINNLTGIEIDEDLAKQVVEMVLKGEKREGNISIGFVGPGRMRKLNKYYRGKNRVTDVLSFSEREVISKEFPKLDNELGEIIICLREIKKNSQERHISFEKELQRILIHSTLHLIGFNHKKEDKEALKMGEKEEKYLNLLN